MATGAATLLTWTIRPPPARRMRGRTAWFTLTTPKKSTSNRRRASSGVVVKKDGSRQSFDRNKILNGMLRACEKRPVSLAALETAALDIEQILQNSLEREVSTGQIGELVMERLKPLDEVAYVRFASVYRQFKDINSFMRELNKILEEK